MIIIIINRMHMMKMNFRLKHSRDHDQWRCVEQNEFAQSTGLAWDRPTWLNSDHATES